MFKNYFKIAVRNLLRHKSYTAINISGLAVGIATCILIMLFVKSEFTYDKFHEKSDRLYRAWQYEKYEGEEFINTVTPLPMGAALQANYPEVENHCRVYSFNPVVFVNNNSFSEDVRMVDSTFFQMFDFNLIKGNRNNPFPTNNTAILTPELAKKYFGETDPVGKSFDIQIGEEKIAFIVSGIVSPAPEESSIKYKMLIPFSNAKLMFRPGLFNSWTNVFNETYILLKKDTNPAALETKFISLIKKIAGEDYSEGRFIIHLQPLTDIHLNNTLPDGNEPVSNPKYSYILGSIGILILLVACINFITLSIGRSAHRAMEVGVRKVLGADKKQLIPQFWGEAFFMTLISVVAGAILAALLIKPFNNLTGKALSLQPDFFMIAFCFLLTCIIALIAGIYPAIILSKFQPVEVLKGRLKLNTSHNWLRRSLVTGQFVASILMIIASIVISAQLKYLRKKDLGYDKEQVVIVQSHKSRKDGMILGEKLRTALLSSPQVNASAVSVYSMAEPAWIELGFTDDRKVYHSFQYNSVDPHWLDLMKVQVKEGRLFSADNPADIGSSAIVNEAFVKEFNIENPVGKKLPGKFEQQIVGVVKDFNFQSLHNTIKPLLVTMTPDSVLRRSENISISFPAQPRVTIRMQQGKISDNIAAIEKAWKSVAPNQDFDYSFLDDKVAAQYENEKRSSTIVRVASILSIFIACMGLFGLATLTVIQRTKEIGIRKVLGAKVISLVALIIKDFLRLVFIAALIATPFAWWFMHSWLKDFAYRIDIQWWYFVVAAAVVLLITIVTVCLQAVKASLANPVKSLRTE